MNLNPNIYPTAARITRAFERALERLAEKLDISDTHFQAAERSYRSVGEWLNRAESKLARFNPSIYTQGSFRLGTVTRPPSDEDCFDLDLVCEVNCSKDTTTQEQLKNALGAELDAYTARRTMTAPEPGQYCWTLHYADSAQFQMDVLPAVPDGAQQRLLLEARQLGTEWVESAIGLTNTRHPHYKVLSRDWPASNPRGYAQWFRSRMQPIFLARRRALALSEGLGDIEKIPDYRVKTPLQAAVQILKRHRDGTFADRPELGPASIIVSTLSAHAYAQEETISGALFSILARMDQFIEDRGGVPWIANPSDGRENFADRWQREPALREAFYEWLRIARADFEAAAALASDDAITEQLAARMGRGLLERAFTGGTTLPVPARPAGALSRILNAPHKQAPTWPVIAAGSVKIVNATASLRGFRPVRFGSNGPALSKYCGLKFEAETSVPWPYQVYWQVVNTGAEARAARCLRGTFELAYIDRGQLVRHESTLYSGTHSIECFIVRNGYCVAQSGPFIVNIK